MFHMCGYTNQIKILASILNDIVAEVITPAVLESITLTTNH